MRVTRRWLVLGVALAFAGGCNCGKKGSSIVGEQGIPDAPLQLNFGNVAVGASVRLQLQVSNSGAGELNLTSQVVAGAAFSEANPFSNTTLDPGAKTFAVMAFSPTVPGPVTGTFTIGDDGDPAQVTVALDGVGLDLALSVLPATVSFGEVPVGSSAPPQTVTLKNTTASPVYVSLGTGATASVYSVTDASGAAVTATPVQLAPNVPYVLTVGFKPDAVSIFNSSFSYTVCEDMTTAACVPAQLVTLAGQGVTGALTLTPNPIVFSSVPDGTSATQTVTVTNVGSATADVTCLYLKSLGPTACGTASASFTLGAPSVALPATLAGGATLTVPLVYQSTGTVPVTDTLVASYLPQGITTAATASDVISASESPSPCAIGLSPTSLAFTYSGAGVPVTETLTVSNTGGTTCQVTGIALDPSSDPGYTLATGQAVTLSIAAGASAPIGVTFELPANTPPNTRLGHLDFATTDPAHATAAVPLVASVVSPYAGGGAWPRWHHDNIQSGLSPADTSGLQGTIAWTYSVGAPGTNFWTYKPTDYMNSPVVATDGTIYQLGVNGTLYAVTPAGAAAWSTPLEGPVSDPHVGTPIILADGSLYVAFGDTVATRLPDGLYHVSSTGAILQSIPPSGTTDGFDLPPLLTNGGFLLGGDDQVRGPASPGAFAFSIGTGGALTLAATTGIPGDFDQISAVVGTDDSTYWCAGGACSALSPPSAGFAAKAGWPNTPGSTQSATSDLALDEFFTGNLMILMGGWAAEAADTATPQQLLSVSLAGATVWSLTLPAASAAQQAAGQDYGGIADATVGNSCPAIGTDGTVYVGNFDGLHAVDGTTGKEKTGWPFLTGDDDVLTAPAIGGDGTIFFGTAGGAFYAVTPAGKQRFKVSAGGRIAGSPAIGPDGTVYFTANDGFLYAVK